MASSFLFDLRHEDDPTLGTDGQKVQTQDHGRVDRADNTSGGLAYL